MGICILAIDQGTHRNDGPGAGPKRPAARPAYREIRQFYPQPGWVEHDPGEIFRSVVETGRQALKGARIRARELAAVGLANQRETFVIWEHASGRPLHRPIVWQSRRGAAICNELRQCEAEINEHTGLLVDPCFTGTELS